MYILIIKLLFKGNADKEKQINKQMWFGNENITTNFIFIFSILPTQYTVYLKMLLLLANYLKLPEFYVGQNAVLEKYAPICHTINKFI